ncbi:MAG TPA: GNAT family N-acetyltransferase [Mucilaginibacter sp.]|jgi:N-acetylglutamate synthase-like GNAT family acetyltransferase|nr:GNAT family N-acetyltransferase [Mucilaginibacter sp.]
MIFRFAEPHEYADVLAHYKACNYNGGLSEDDTVLVAIDDDIIGAVRICSENETKVLRGMQIKPEYRHRGIGKQMLRHLREHLDIKGCYCLPYTHLETFYATIGFMKISPDDAPQFLTERLKNYLSAGYDLIIMKSSG